jgi:predicted lipoprotein with Yx(FWY)xxD motif
MLPLNRSWMIFMRRFATTLTIVLAGAIAMSAAAFAEPPAPAGASKAAGATVTDAPAVTTGTINLDPTFEQRMSDCMAIWEPRTHMSKQQWRRTCKTTLREFGN